MQRIEIKTTQNVTIEYELASLRERIFAFLIDLIIVGFVATMLIYLIISFVDPLEISDGLFQRIFTFIPLFGFIGYQFFLELLNDGQSIGKRAMNIRVVRLDGRQPGPGDYLLRAFFHITDTIFSSGTLAALVISTTAKRQRLGDMTANTAVIRTRNELDFRLADILRINSLEDYEPTYPAIKNFSDQDMLLIKGVLGRFHDYPNDAHEEVVLQLVQRVRTQLQIPEPPEKRRPIDEEIDFLKTLLKDYIVLTR